MFKLRSILMLPGFKIPPKSQKITKKRISKKVYFQKSMKNGFEPITRCSFSCRIRFRIQTWTKTKPKADFYQFSKIAFFIRIPTFMGRRHRPEALFNPLILTRALDDEPRRQLGWPSRSLSTPFEWVRCRHLSNG